MRSLQMGVACAMHLIILVSNIVIIIIIIIVIIITIIIIITTTDIIILVIMRRFLTCGFSLPSSFSLCFIGRMIKISRNPSIRHTW